MDLVFYSLLVILTALQIWKFSSITNSQTESKEASASIDGENKLIVTIVDINNNYVSGVEACVSLLNKPSSHQCQNSADNGKVTFMLKSGNYLFGFGTKSKNLPITTTPEFDIKDGQTIETKLTIGK